METIENTLEQASGILEKLNGAPALTLVLISCFLVGYGLKLSNKFPNQGIPVAVMLWGAILYPIIASANNELTLRVWIVRNLVVGGATGFAAWLIHKLIFKKIIEKFGLFNGKADDEVKVPPATPPAQPPVLPPAP